MLAAKTITTTLTSTHPATGSPLKNLSQNNSKSALTPSHLHYDDHFDKRNHHRICYPTSTRVFMNYVPLHNLLSVALTKIVFELSTPLAHVRTNSTSKFNLLVLSLRPPLRLFSTPAPLPVIYFHRLSRLVVASSLRCLPPSSPPIGILTK